MIIRGGTSKGLYLLDADLPPAGEERDKVLLRLMGSPDLRQIDGLGGAQSVTSKAAILAPSNREGVDVDFTFAQVSIDMPLVSYVGNCGNISVGAGPYAIECGLVKADSPVTRVRIFNTNTKKIIEEEIQTPDGYVDYSGDFKIPGVPGKAAPVKVVIQDPAGSVCGSLLPTGNVVDRLDVADFGSIDASLVDAANPLMFIFAKDVGLNGKENPNDICAMPGMLELLEKIRGEGARKLKFIENSGDSPTKSPTVPKLTLIAPPSDYVCTTGETIKSDEVDILGRMMTMQQPHHTYALTGALCTAAAAAINGTLVQKICRPDADLNRLRIGHPGGVSEAGVDFETIPKRSGNNTEGIHLVSAYSYRTARLLMKGTAFF